MPRRGPGARGLWGFDGAQSGGMRQSGRSSTECHRADVGWRRGEAGFLEDAAGEKRGYGSARQSRPLSAWADEERTPAWGNRCR